MNIAVSQEEWGQQREQILTNMQLVMGALPDDSRRVPLDVQVIETEELSRVTRMKITYVPERGDRISAYLLVPRELNGPAPAMVCLHGTGQSRGKTAGLGTGAQYTLDLAERGYVTIAPDYPLIGENTVAPSSLGYVSGTMKGIWDHMRAVDLLQALPEVDRERIGCIGLSLGGHNTLFLAAFDQRIQVAVTSCGFDSFFDYMDGKLDGWCQECYMPRIATVYGKDPEKLPFDFPEVLAAIAPRPVFVHAPISDSNFRVASVRRCIEAALPVYRLLGAPDQLVAIYPEGGHAFPPEQRDAAYRFVDQALAFSI
jgi:pimeloyl-ACP methyl ester carboxylesterase